MGREGTGGVGVEYKREIARARSKTKRKGPCQHEEGGPRRTKIVSDKGYRTCQGRQQKDVGILSTE